MFDNLKPDVVVTVADRYETLSTAVAAAYMNIPVAHIQGGEVTGSIDEKVRHAVTKLADVHLVSTDKAAERVIRMGEDPSMVFVTGCPSIDLAATMLEDPGLDFDVFERYGGVGPRADLSNGYLVVMQHPVTTEYHQARRHVTETLRVVKELDLPALWFWPNVDAGADGTSSGIRTFREEQDPRNIHFFKNMSPVDFLKLLHNSRCLIGNSSVGIRECSFLGVPVVNIGSRQAGRDRGGNVVDAGYDREEIAEAVERQLHNGRFSPSPLLRRRTGRAPHRAAPSVTWTCGPRSGSLIERVVMNSVVLVPDGVGVRNFVLGRFLPRLSELGDVHVVHQIPAERLSEYRPDASGRVEWHNFSTYRETPLSFTLRYSLSYAQMHWVGTKAMRYHLERVPAKGSWRTRSADRAARFFGRVAASPARIGTVDRWHQAAVDRMPAVDHWQALFERIRPSVLFCSHQRPPIILPPVLAARRCGIPTATFIFSWDNMTSKGRIAAPFDHYLVWSDLMRRELLRYYPDVGPDRIHVVGTPQFDPYADERLRWSREEFFRRIKADPSRQLICFSGNNVDNGPEDQAQVRILMDFIRSGRITGNPQVLLRPAPVDDGTRFDAVRRDFPELIYAHPGWSGTQMDWATSCRRLRTSSSSRT